MRRILIIGCGFLGEAAAFLFQQFGWEVHGVTVSQDSADTLMRRGITAYRADITSEESLKALHSELGDFDWWIHCASSGKGGADQYRAVYQNGIANLLKVFGKAQGIFTSSTSVYAQTDGVTVDETSATFPTRETGQILLASEHLLLTHAGIVARFAGLYGPERSVLFRKFLTHQAFLENGGERWINQIHRQDGAHALLTLAQLGKAGEIYNVVDNEPMRQKQLYQEMAKRLKMDIPIEIAADYNRKRGWTHKRVSNQKLRSLGWQPAYPNYFTAWEEFK